MEPKKNQYIEPEKQACSDSLAAPCYPLPCPFCGEVDGIVERCNEDTSGYSLFFIYCRECDIKGSKQSNLEAAVEKWNRRVEVCV